MIRMENRTSELELKNETSRLRLEDRTSELELKNETSRLKLEDRTISLDFRLRIYTEYHAEYFKILEFYS